MDISLMVEALKLMVLGMGVVFIFLAVLVYILKLQSFLVKKFFPEKEPIPESLIQSSDNSKKVAAIVAAIQHHNNISQ